MNTTARKPISAAAAMLSGVITLGLAACGSPEEDQAPTASEPAMESLPSSTAALSASEDVTAAARIESVLAGQSDAVKARYGARHPAETLAFFGIEPGLTVLEADPSGGWYSRILLEVLGPEGKLVGADYPMAVYRLFDYYSEEELAAKETWSQSWPLSVKEDVAGPAATDAYSLDALPESLNGTLDAVLFIRVLHNLADFEEEGAFYSNALADAYRVLKPGGVVGVVQHMAPETNSDEWASGANGYLKKSFLIRSFEEAGFQLEGSLSINENPLDVPSEEESVWRLPPTSEVEDEALAETYAAIGESTRMTLKFRKP